MMDKREKVGKLIKSLRESRRMTQLELSELIRQSPSSITMYETGRRAPSYETLEAIADVFNMPLSLLLGESSVVSTSEWDPDSMAWADHEDESTRIMARGMAKMSPENRRKLVEMAKLMFAEDFDEKGNKKNAR